MLPTAQPLEMKPGSWVVCLDVDLNPSTWGKVTRVSEGSADVQYGNGAPLWHSPSWKSRYLKPVESEREAMRIVNDHEDSVKYCPRS